MPERPNWEQTRFLCHELYEGPSGRFGLAELRDSDDQANGLSLKANKTLFWMRDGGVWKAAHRLIQMSTTVGFHPISGGLFLGLSLRKQQVFASARVMV